MKKTAREGGFLVSKIHQSAKRIFSKKLRDEGLGEINSAQGRILFVLWKKDGIPISELAQKTALEKSTLTAMLDRLEQKGLLARVRRPGDRRKILVARTPANERLEKKFKGVSEKMTSLFYNGFSDGERDQFERFLRRVFANLGGKTG
ncbi:MAG: MarR family transcriptional regulator [Nitrospinae bacterium]|nr:MarR family transcriptional regulator [Nitrospinota bacterium]